MHTPAHIGHFSGCENHAGCWCETRRYLLVFLISVGILGVETGGWWLSDSLALLGDAGHVAVDMCAMGVALVVSIFVRVHPDRNVAKVRMGGFALQIILLSLVAGFLFVHGYERVVAPVSIVPIPLLVSAVVGGCLNILQVWILETGEKNITSHGARAHLFADLLTSVGVVASGVVIMLTGWHHIDGIVSIGIACFIVWQVYALTRHAKNHSHHHDHI
ncbi:MAG: cation diffusion facilitator family transporter [Patescibacteria group bacterium]